MGTSTALRVPGWKRVADRLADHRWHSSYELTHELSVMSHSRLAQLRSMGYVIERRRVSGAEGLKAFEYRLVSTPGELTTGDVAQSHALTPAVIGQAAAGERKSAGILGGRGSTPPSPVVSSPGSGAATVGDRGPSAELDPAPAYIDGQLNLWEAPTGRRARAAA